MESSYRPHNPGHDYYSPGIYLITLVVRNRRMQYGLLGSLNDDVKNPDVKLTELGTVVMEEWEKTPAIQAKRGNKISVISQVCMPDHWHGVIQVHEQMNRSLGHIVQYVKSACTARWRAITGCELDSSSSQAIRGMSEKQRDQYYASLPLTMQPLWDDHYDDTICLRDDGTGGYDERHRAAMIGYVRDNARRAIIRRLRPQFMERRLHIKLVVPDKDGMAKRDGNGRIITRDYAAFGNLFLLRWVRKVQVFCHRRAADGRTPYERTEEYRDRCREWKRMVMEGQTVMVTPGISMGERIIKDRCLESGYPLIHLQKEPITALWKPEKRRFDACCRGSLLILAPWGADELGVVTTIYGRRVPSGADYSIFHNLNGLAEEICLFDGEAVIVGG